MDVKINFLYQSISDIQSTIRAIDIKLGFLFAIIFSPVLGVPQVASMYEKLFMNEEPLFIQFFAVAVLIIWVFSLYVIFISLVAISNPISHVLRPHSSGIFFSGNQFNISWRDYIYNSKISSVDTIAEHMDLLPNTYESLISELVFEKLKLAYIRDIKLIRSRFCFQLVFAWIVLGSFVWGFLTLKGDFKC